MKYSTVDETMPSPSAGRSRNRVVVAVFVALLVVGLVGIISGRATGEAGTASQHLNVANPEKMKIHDDSVIVKHGTGQNGNEFVWSEIVASFQAQGCPGIRRNENGWNEITMDAISCEITETQIIARARGIHRAWYVVQEVTINKNGATNTGTGTVKKGELTVSNGVKQAPTVRNAKIDLIFQILARTSAPTTLPSSVLCVEIQCPPNLPKQVAVKSLDNKKYTFFPKVYGEGSASGGWSVIDGWALGLDGSLKEVETVYGNAGIHTCTVDTATPTGAWSLHNVGIGHALPLPGSPPCQTTSFVWYY